MCKLIMLWAFVANCAYSQTLTLEDCIRLAQSAPSSVTAARLQTDIARYGLTQSRANFLPQFSVANGYTYNNPLPGVADAFSFVSLNGIHEYMVLPTSSMELDTSGRLRAIRERARADQQAANVSLALAQRDLRRLVATSYFRLLVARRLIKVAEDTLAEAQSFDKRTRLLFDNAEVAQADVVKAAGQVAFLEQMLQAAQLETRLANHELASFWTTDVETTLNIADMLDEKPVAPEPYSASAGDNSFLKRPEFRLFEAQRFGFLADRKRARADRLPQANLVFQWGIDSTRFNFNRDRATPASCI